MKPVERLERALDQAEAAITEGRDAVQGLRSTATTRNDLANGIAAIGAELSSDQSAVAAAAIEVEVDGASRDLNPVVREEAYRIAGEALRNAFKHAQARQIIVHDPLRGAAASGGKLDGICQYPTFLSGSLNRATDDP